MRFQFSVIHFLLQFIISYITSFIIYQSFTFSLLPHNSPFHNGLLAPYAVDYAYELSVYRFFAHWYFILAVFV